MAEFPLARLPLLVLLSLSNSNVIPSIWQVLTTHSNYSSLSIPECPLSLNTYS